MRVPVVYETAAGRQADGLDARVRAIITQPFDLAAGPLLRSHVLELAPDDHVLVLVVHHIVADGWSMGVLFGELADAYAAFAAGRAPRWAPLPVQYADYALWQRAWLGGGELARQLGYWRDALACAPAALALPTDRPRRPVQAHRGARCSAAVNATTTAALKSIARDQGATLFMVLLAAFDTVLARYTGETELVVGTPVAGRGRTELEGLIGFFVNTLALRIDASGDPTFGELVARVRRVTLDAFAHQDAPFEQVVEALDPDRDTGRTPLFQVMFNLHNEPRGTLQLSGLDVRSVTFSRDTAKFDWSVSLHESRDGLQIVCEYDTDLFDAGTLANVLEYYTQVLTAVSTEPGLRLSSLPAASRGAAPRLAGGAGVAGADLVTAFEAVARRGPSQPAVRGAQASLSYGTLSGQANGVAAALRSTLHSTLAAAEPAPRVGLLAAQDAPLVAGLLGILKAGGAYVPLDPSLPAARRVAIAEDAGVVAVVSDARCASLARTEFAQLPVIDATAVSPATDPGWRPAPAALAYVLYTSGTTGRPKGVRQTHSGAHAQVTRYARSLGLGPADRVSLLSGYAYDAAVQDIFGTLLTGGCLYPFDVRAAADPLTVVAGLSAARVTVVHLTPTVFRHLYGAALNCDHDLEPVRAVVLGGEEARRSDFELYCTRFGRGTVLVNGYGLTESTMGLQARLDHETRVLGQTLPLGDAVEGIEVALFDARDRRSWQGEIRLRGDGVFGGYWEDAAGTAARRTADGWFCTGDLGRRLPDGQVVFTGRRDAQFQLRGQRVEPGEIEAVLGSLAGVEACAVRWFATPGAGRLVAYVVAPGVAEAQRGARESAWRAALGERLPAHMVPQGFEWLAALPRRANGKLAREALPAPGRAAARAPVPARTELEAVLTGIWREVLGIETLGVYDDFFALGGHSLLATRLVARLRDRLGVELPLAAFFNGPTVADTALLIAAERARAAQSDAAKIAPIARQPRAPRQRR